MTYIFTKYCASNCLGFELDFLVDTFFNDKVESILEFLLVIGITNYFNIETLFRFQNISLLQRFKNTVFIFGKCKEISLDDGLVGQSDLLNVIFEHLYFSKVYFFSRQLNIRASWIGFYFDHVLNVFVWNYFNYKVHFKSFNASGCEMYVYFNRRFRCYLPLI